MEKGKIINYPNTSETPPTPGYEQRFSFERVITAITERQRVRRPVPNRTEEEVHEDKTPTGDTSSDKKTGSELKAELDELLDEIDEVLEDNAEEFVRSYVQKGGE